MTSCSTRILENDGEFSCVLFELDRWSEEDTYYLSASFNAYGTGSMLFKKGSLEVNILNGSHRYIVRRNQYDAVARGSLLIAQSGSYYHSQGHRSFYDYFDGHFFIRLRTPSTSRAVTIESGGHSFKMFRGGSSRGYTYFQAQIAASTLGNQYSFLDGGRRIPGTYPLSIVAPLRPEWVSRRVFYQIFPDRFSRSEHYGYEGRKTVAWYTAPAHGLFFGGNLKGIEEKLDYLSGMGVTALYLTPVFSAGTEHRYDTRDYFTIDPLLGTERDMASLVSECHRRGISVVLDAVFNHTGTSFGEFLSFLDGKSEWYIGHGKRELYTGRYDMKKGGTPRPSYETWEGAGSLPKLNLATPAVRRYLLSVLSYWTEHAGVDGWRFDVGESLSPAFLAEIRDLLKTGNSDSYMLGEIWKNPSFWLDSSLYDATMNYVFRDAVLLFAARKIGPAAFIRRVFSLYAHIPHSASVSQYNMLGSHDTPRLATILGSKSESISLALALLFSLPGAPAIYYGDEFMMKGAEADGARGTVDWSSKPLFSELIRSFSRLRRGNRSMCSGSLEAVTRNSTLMIVRRIDEDSMVFICNNTPGPRHVSIDGIELISSGTEADGSGITLSPFGWIFLRER